MNPPEILVTLSTFGQQSPQPKRLLEQSGYRFTLNPNPKRMDPAEVIAAAPEAIGIIAGVEPYSKATIDRLPRLRCISRCGAGTDAIDAQATAARRIQVLNTPDEPVPAVAELTLAMMLALLRRLTRVDALMHSRQWGRIPGNLLQGKTVGIIGVGRIGQRVARLVRAFDANVVGHDPARSPEWWRQENITPLSLQELLQRADIVSLHASGTPGVLIGDAQLGLMKPSAFLLNLARGGLVDETALARRLRDGQLAGAALDVYEKEPYTGPLCDVPQAILSPHQATLTAETRTAMEIRAVQNLLTALGAPSR